MRLAINDNATVRWERLGNHTDILVMDDVFKDAHALRRLALSLRFDFPARKDSYPGFKAVTTLPGAADFSAFVATEFLNKQWGREWPECVDLRASRPSPQIFGVMAIDRAKTNTRLVDQHVDNFAWIATVTYLFDPYEPSNLNRGTAFWTHKSTGFQHWLDGDATSIDLAETVFGLRMRDSLAKLDASKRAMHLQTMGRSLFEHIDEKRTLFSRSDDRNWQLLKAIPAKFNRLVAYPTFQIHSPLEIISASLTVDNARLTLNSFIAYPIRGHRTNRTTYDPACYLSVDGLIRS